MGAPRSIRLDLYAPGTAEAWKAFAKVVLPPAPPSQPDLPGVEGEEEDDWWEFDLLSDDLCVVISGTMHTTEPDPDGDTFHVGLREVRTADPPFKPPEEVVAESKRLGGTDGFMGRLARAWPAQNSVVRYDVSYELGVGAWRVAKLAALQPTVVTVESEEHQAIPAVQGWRFNPAVGGLSVLTFTGDRDNSAQLRCGGTWTGRITSRLFEDVRTSCSSAVRRLASS